MFSDHFDLNTFIILLGWFIGAIINTHKRRKIVNQCLETIIKVRETDHKHNYCKFVDYTLWGFDTRKLCHILGKPVKRPTLFLERPECT